MSNDNLKERLTDMSVLASSRTPADALQYIEALEAKLARAVEVMREAIRLSEQPHYGDRDGALDHCFDAIDVLRTTIAELTGGKDD